MLKSQKLRKLLCLCSLPCSWCPDQKYIHVFPPIHVRKMPQCTQFNALLFLTHHSLTIEYIQKARNATHIRHRREQIVEEGAVSPCPLFSIPSQAFWPG